MIEESEALDDRDEEAHDGIYSIASEIVADWPDDLFEGEGPRLFTIGDGELASVEIGPSRVVLVGGGPGVGKTALVMQWVFDALLTDPTLRAAVSNVEMSAKVLLERQLSRLSNVPLSAITHRQISVAQRTQITSAVAKIKELAERIAFVQNPGSFEYLAATIEDFGGDFVVLDYLQRIGCNREDGDRRANVDALMGELRQIASDGRAVVAVSAVARGKDKNGRSSYDPTGLSLASFRESSELEYGADAAYLLTPHAGASDLMDLVCLKHRHGEPKSIGLKFERAVQQFVPIPLLPPKTLKQTPLKRGVSK